jgi:hypothetical protein
MRLVVERLPSWLRHEEAEDCRIWPYLIEPREVRGPSRHFGHGQASGLHYPCDRAVEDRNACADLVVAGHI